MQEISIDRIASPQDLQAEIRAIMAFVHASEKPDRQVIASKLHSLADRVGGSTRMAGPAHASLFQKLVQTVDKFEDSNKNLQRSAPKILRDIKDAVAQSHGADPDSNLMYGFQQQMSLMKEAMDDANHAANTLGDAYDEFNRWASKWLR